MVAVNDFQDCVEILKEAKRHFRDSLSAFEFFDKHSMQAMTSSFPEQVQYPFGGDTMHRFFLNIEVEAYGPEDDVDGRLFSFLEKIGDRMEDGVVAQDSKQFDQLWFLRKGIITSGTQMGTIYQGNLAVPDLANYYDVIEAMHSRLAETEKLTAEEKDLVRILGYGHLADGDIQITLVTMGHNDETKVLREKVSNVFD